MFLVYFGVNQCDACLFQGFGSEENSVPPEIRARGPEALKAYEVALEGGKINNRRLLILVLGSPRAGKTSLLRSLKGEILIINTTKQSTTTNVSNKNKINNKQRPQQFDTLETS
jgi:ribosome biogenesis GTPase A